MNELIESGDPRAKVVGKRRPQGGSTPQALAAFDRHQRQMGRLWGSLPFQTGVYRFSTTEQFEEWTQAILMRNSPARR
jgi:hypothetical protein